MRKLMLVAAFTAPFLVNSIAKAQDDDSTKKPAKTTKKMKKTKKTKNTDGSETKTTTEKTEKPADAPANP